MNSKQHAPAADTPRPSAALSPAAVAALCIVAMAVLIAVGGWLPGLRGWDDPDSAMRLVEVRAFLDGRGWFDMLEPRLAPPDGVVMHWSRLVDLPIAGLILAAEPVLGRADAELMAVNLWPPLVFVAFGAGLAVLVRRFADGFAVAVALVLALLSPFVTGVFAPGRIDHHNVQLALLVWVLAGLAHADRRPVAASAAALGAALSLAVGLESLPLLIVAAGAFALAWARDGERWRAGAVGFGIVFAFAVPIAFAATVGTDRWLDRACDAISPGYAIVAAFTGSCFAIAALVLRGGRSDGAAGLLLRGAAVVGIASLALTVSAFVFPECLAGPYAAVDPRLGPIWLDHVVEAWSIADVARATPALLPMNLAAPLLALTLGLVAAVRAPGETRAPLLGLLAGLAAATALGMAQQRFLVAAHALSAATGAVSTALVAGSIGAGAGLAAPVVRSLWVLLAPMVWFAAGSLVADPAAGTRRDTALARETECLGAIGDRLAAAPAGLVAAPGNYGAYLLLTTGSSVLAAPYHRNARGLLAADAVLAGPDPEGAARAAGAAYVAICPGDPETRLVVRRAPDGLAARLAGGERPDWLVPLQDGPGGLVFAVRDDDPAVDVTGTLPAPRLRPALP